ncbi:hypothetical protein O9992_04365 [Vibrio lentus]|nr:hypothetical protein [Vibrio lentus]
MNPKLEAPVVTPQTQEDVWKRIAMQLEMEVPDQKKVDYYRTWYLKHPSHLKPSHNVLNPSFI